MSARLDQKTKLDFSQLVYTFAEEVRGKINGRNQNTWEWYVDVPESIEPTWKKFISKGTEYMKMLKIHHYDSPAYTMVEAHWVKTCFLRDPVDDVLKFQQVLTRFFMHLSNPAIVPLDDKQNFVGNLKRILSQRNLEINAFIFLSMASDDVPQEHKKEALEFFGSHLMKFSDSEVSHIVEHIFITMRNEHVLLCQLAIYLLDKGELQKGLTVAEEILKQIEDDKALDVPDELLIEFRAKIVQAALESSKKLDRNALFVLECMWSDNFSPQIKKKIDDLAEANQFNQIRAFCDRLTGYKDYAISLAFSHLMRLNRLTEAGEILKKMEWNPKNAAQNEYRNANSLQLAATLVRANRPLEAEELLPFVHPDDQRKLGQEIFLGYLMVGDLAKAIEWATATLKLEGGADQALETILRTNFKVKDMQVIVACAKLLQKKQKQALMSKFLEAGRKELAYQLAGKWNKVIAACKNISEGPKQRHLQEIFTQFLDSSNKPDLLANLEPLKELADALLRDRIYKYLSIATYRDNLVRAKELAQMISDPQQRAAILYELAYKSENYELAFTEIQNFTDQAAQEKAYEELARLCFEKRQLRIAEACTQKLRGAPKRIVLLQIISVYNLEKAGKINIKNADQFTNSYWQFLGSLDEINQLKVTREPLDELSDPVSIKKAIVGQHKNLPKLLKKAEKAYQELEKEKQKILKRENCIALQKPHFSFIEDLIAREQIPEAFHHAKTLSNRLRDKKLSKEARAIRYLFKNLLHFAELTEDAIVYYSLRDNPKSAALIEKRQELKKRYQEQIKAPFNALMSPTAIKALCRYQIDLQLPEQLERIYKEIQAIDEELELPSVVEGSLKGMIEFDRLDDAETLADLIDSHPAADKAYISICKAYQKKGKPEDALFVCNKINNLSLRKKTNKTLLQA